MAHILQSKPRYRPRGVVSFYLQHGRLVARGWRQPGPDPKTARQLTQRDRMTCASSFLKHFAPIVSRGYLPGSQANGRTIGAYHMALSRVMREHTQYGGGRWHIDYSGVQLACGRRFPLRGLTAQRTAGRLELRWLGRTPSAARLLRVALYDAHRGESRLLAMPLPAAGNRATIALPSGWGARTLHLWIVLEDSNAKMPWASHYVPLAGGTGSSTGGSAPGDPITTAIGPNPGRKNSSGKSVGPSHGSGAIAKKDRHKTGRAAPPG